MVEVADGVVGTTTEFKTKRRQIIEYAAEVFAERGFVAGTTKEIANRMGFSQPAIYHYVGSKEDLLQEIAVQVRSDAMAALQRGLDAGDTPGEQLRGFIREFTAAVVKDRLPFTVYYKELHALPDEIQQEWREKEAEFQAGVRGVVGRLQENGVFPADKSPMVLAAAIIGMVSWVHRWYRPSGPLDAEAIAENFISVIGLEDV